MSAAQRLTFVAMAKKRRTIDNSALAWELGEHACGRPLPLGSCCWLAFSGEMVALAVIAMVASAMAGGGRIVLICAATMFVNAGLVFHFVGLSFPVYVSSAVAVLFLAGGLMQGKHAV